MLYRTYLVKASHPEAPRDKKGRLGLAIVVSIGEGRSGEPCYLAQRPGFPREVGADPEHAIRNMMRRHAYTILSLELLGESDE